MNPKTAPSSPDTSRLGDSTAKGIRRISSDSLLAGAREVIIEHRGRDYRLQITPNGKLILKK